MKKLLIMLLCLFPIACATIYPPAPPGMGVCDKNPDAVLCKAFAYIQISPEQANDMLLDASLVSVWQKWMKADELEKSINKVEKWFNENPEVSLETVIKYVVKESEVDPALALLLSRRLEKLVAIPEISFLVLDPVSRQMILDHFANQREQLSWF